MTYAADTRVSAAASRAEIEQLVKRRGATGFVSGWETRGATIMFEIRGRRVRFFLPSPPAEKFAKTPKGQRRSPKDQQSAVEQHERSSWRALALVIKAKLEAVESGISVFESEFLANIVIPGTQDTVGEWALPRLQEAYSSGKPMPKLLGGAS